jgi:hypothetical protein
MGGADHDRAARRSRDRRPGPVRGRDRAARVPGRSRLRDHLDRPHGLPWCVATAGGDPHRSRRERAAGDARGRSSRERACRVGTGGAFKGQPDHHGVVSARCHRRLAGPRRPRRSLPHRGPDPRRVRRRRRRDGDVERHRPLSVLRGVGISPGRRLMGATRSGLAGRRRGPILRPRGRRRRKRRGRVVRVGARGAGARQGGVAAGRRGRLEHAGDSVGADAVFPKTSHSRSTRPGTRSPPGSRDWDPWSWRLRFGLLRRASGGPRPTSRPPTNPDIR